MAKIQCKFCKLEYNGKCVKKKTSVKVNKKRDCQYYDVDVERVTDLATKKLAQDDIPTIFRPDWWWDRETRRELRRAAIAKEMKKYKPDISAPIAAPSQHPLTGDLSRFIGSTANEE
jgi:hypothetical protein